WAAGTCALIVAYPLQAILVGPQHIVGPPHPLAQLYSLYGDLLGAVQPSPLIRFAPASLLHSSASLIQGNLQETGTYLGAPLVLIAACLAIAYRRRPVTAIAGVLAVVSYALSLGTRIAIRNHGTSLPGPFAALAHVPFIQDIEPARFSLFTALFVAIVLGTGLDALARPRRAAAAAAPPSGSAAAPLPPGAATGSPPSRAAGAPSSAGAVRWTRPALAVVLRVAPLLPPLPPRPHPARPDLYP